MWILEEYMRAKINGGTFHCNFNFCVCRMLSPRLVPFLLAILVISGIDADGRILRPCFERYANHRLVNVRPYHSEWRMKSEDSCLLFCSQSASRCRSVVYDTVQHICHYFSDEGVDQAIISAKMTYLRVVSKECLEENADLAADPNSLVAPNAPPTLLTSSSELLSNNVVQQELEIPRPPIETIEEPTTTAEGTTTLPEVVTFEQITTSTLTPEIIEEDLDMELKNVMETSQFQGSFNDDKGDDFPQEQEGNLENNGIYRDKTHNQERWLESMEKMENLEKKPSEGKKSLDEKLEKLKKTNPQKYSLLMGDEEKEEEEEEVENLKKNLRYGAKVIKFDEEAAFRKQTELRRKPIATTKRPYLKPVTISATSYIQKAKSFLDGLNEQEEEENEEEKEEEVEELPVITTECSSDDVSVWIAFENSEQDESRNEQDASVVSRKDCQSVCEQKNCRSFTFYDKTRTCHLSSKSDGVSLKMPRGGDFTASSSTKFCYPKSFSVFDGCSNFVAFRDYSLKIEAAEEFDGLPRGYDGMQLCIELCVLSTRYTCASATFNPITGKCRLLTEDSLSNPDSFRYNSAQKELYFENGCNFGGAQESKETPDGHIEVMNVKPRKVRRRIRKMKKLRRRRL